MKNLIFALILAFSFLSFGFGEDFHLIQAPAPFTLGTRLEIPVPLDVLKKEKEKTEIHVSVTNEICGWTVVNPRNVYLTNGSQKIHPEPFGKADGGNCGRIGPDEKITLGVTIPDGFWKNAAPDSVKLIFEAGIFSWETPRGEFALEAWTGEKLRVQSETDPYGRIVRLKISGVMNIQKTILELPDGDRIEVSGEAEPRFLFRFPVLQKGARDFPVGVTIETAGGAVRTKKVRIPVPEIRTGAPLADGEILVGVCFYSSFRPEFMDDFLREKGGNLAVFWPGAPEKSSDPDLFQKYVARLAEAGVYSMTIYQNAPHEKVKKLNEAGKNRYFLQNNIGEYASYMYQGIDSARACRVPQGKDLMDCRDFFVNEYIPRALEMYARNYPYFFSTSGASLAHYELEGGIPFICSELYAIGAQNLAWASSEMRGAARQWKPEFWGGWLAHEWQTCAVPYQCEQKFRLLRAGFLQQYLMGSSLMILESGSQSTQAGEYTTESGKRNFPYEHEIPARYRAEVKRFYDFVQKSPKRTGSPKTPIALALGNGDAYVGLNLSFPVWAQHENAAKDPRWRYGDAQKSSALLQSIFCPLAADALKPYSNHWLAGSPFGQVDVVGIDDLTRLEDLSRYELIVYGGWNSMDPRIFRLLQRYVEAGGELVLAVPHLSTRTDCEGVNYGVSDLIHGGDLSGLMNLKITGRKGNFAEFQPVPGAAQPEIIETKDGQPVWVGQKSGKGRVSLFLGWEYPGQEKLSPLYEAKVRETAGRFVGSVRVETAPENQAAISWAVYDDCVFILNLDAAREIPCVLHLGEKKQEIVIPPTEMVRVAL